MKNKTPLYRAAENFVAAFSNWKAHPDMRRRNHMIKRRLQLIHAARAEQI